MLMFITYLLSLLHYGRKHGGRYALFERSQGWIYRLQAGQVLFTFAQYHEVTLPSFTTPEISFILRVFNQVRWTFKNIKASAESVSELIP